MKLQHAILLAATAFALGCNKTVQIVDGEIPAEFQAEAAKYLGVYNGSIEGRDGQLELALENNKVVVGFVSADGSNDLVNEKCVSQVGALTEVTVDGKKRELRALSFQFDAGTCRRIQGRSLEIAVREKNGKVRLTTNILSYTSRHRTPGHCYGSGPERYCSPGDWSEVDHFISGRFEKIAE